MSSPVIAVSEDDEKVKEVPREKAHTGQGTRHRAYTIAVFDGQSNLLLAKRSQEKTLWNGYWDGTVASHPGSGQSVYESAVRRLDTELGIQNDQYDEIERLGCFEYREYYKDIGVEWEVCHLLSVVLNESGLAINRNEVGEVQWYNFPNEILEILNRQLNPICPWFKLANNTLRNERT